MGKYYKRIILIAGLFVILTFTVIYMATDKQDIRYATLQEIEQVYDIGPILAKEIQDYAIKNDVKSVKDLDVKYVGEIRINHLRKKFK
jgi:DNA uptake protein ComE-like DNA-binding protein